MNAEASVSLNAPTERQRAWRVYGEAVGATRDIYRTLEPKVKSAAFLFWPENLIREMWALLRGGDQELLALFYRSVPDHFLFGHVPNITILSLKLGLVMGLEEEDAITLGLAAFLSELGLAPQLELLAKATKLTEEEYRLLRSHVQEGLALLDLFSIPESPRKETLRTVIGQCHERIGGKGYPAGLKKDAIHPFAKIIGLVDSFEAMTHVRPWRARGLAHDVLRRMVEENQEDFDPLIIRALVDSLSFYPPGTYVQLSSGDRGRVFALNNDLPLRPRVWLFLDGAGRRLSSPRAINLLTEPSVFVVNAVDEMALAPTDARLALELRAQGWWVRGG